MTRKRRSPMDTPAMKRLWQIIEDHLATMDPAEAKRRIADVAHLSRSLPRAKRKAAL